MIETYKPFIEGLLKSESWRAGPGDTIKSLCTGGLSFDGSQHWLCTCGRIGTTPMTLHFPLRDKQIVTFFRRFKRALSPATTVGA